LEVYLEGIRRLGSATIKPMGWSSGRAVVSGVMGGVTGSRAGEKWSGNIEIMSLSEPPGRSMSTN
jgi:hypothetical protein